jgi:hypothetical protein
MYIYIYIHKYTPYLIRLPSIIIGRLRELRRKIDIEPEVSIVRGKLLRKSSNYTLFHYLW